MASVKEDWKRELSWKQTVFNTIGVFAVELLAYQIGQVNFIYILDMILGWAYDVICIFYTFFRLKYLRN